MPALSVTEIRALLAALDGPELAAALATHSGDPRTGVQAACASAAARLRRDHAEDQRLEALYAMEACLHGEGCLLVAGVDEVGRGALAGPLTAAAVVLPPSPRIRGLNDSKALTPQRRQQVSEVVRSVAIAVAVAHVPARDVDALGMTRALKRAMLEAIGSLGHPIDGLLVDGLPLRLSLELAESHQRPIGARVQERAIVKGDSTVAAIAAASVVAKVERDALMRDLANRFPGYEFDLNKGYGSPEHLAAIERLGTTPEHRRSFGPCTSARLF